MFRYFVNSFIGLCNVLVPWPPPLTSNLYYYPVLDENAIADSSATASISPLPLQPTGPFSHPGSTSNNTQIIGTNVPKSSPSTSSPSDANGASSSGTCFPSLATVQLDTGVKIRMSDLHLGDRVRASKTVYSPVYLFTHRTSKHSAPSYLRLVTEANHTLTLTPSHLIYLNKNLVPARDARVGDMLLTVLGWSHLTAIQSIDDVTGLYNPQTLHGDIVVDGVIVSTFTQLVSVQTATGLLTPIRALFRAWIIDENSAGHWFQAGVLSSALSVLF